MWRCHRFRVGGRRNGGINERNKANRDSVKVVSAGNPTNVQLGKIFIEGLSSMR